MESFLLKAYDLCNIGRTVEEKEWLQVFVDHIQEHLCEDPSFQNHLNTALGVLEKLSKNKDGFGQQQLKPTVYHLFPIGDLITKDKVCSGCLTAEGVKPTFHEQLTDCKELVPVTPSFLLGYLRWNPSQSVSSETPSCGSLFLQDNTGFLPIEISRPDKSCLDQLVIITNWTYVPLPGNITHLAVVSGYIEATSCTTALMKNCRPSPSPSPYVSSLSLSDYKQYQRDGKQKVFNLHGMVTAVSPVHSMFQAKPFFLVQLTCSRTLITTSIVVQGAHFMHWVHFLHVDSEYVLTDLRETTMNKKTINERKVLATSKTSKFMAYFPQNELETTKKRKKPIIQNGDEDSTRKRSKGKDGNAQLPTVDTSDQARCYVLSKVGAPTTISYSGVITKCFPQPNIGCYELDGNIRLYIIHQPCPQMGRGWRVGATVSLHNVHPIKKGKDFLGLCCCTLSSVRISKYSTLDSEWKPLAFNTSPFALHGQNMTFLEYDSFTHACEKLLTKFSRSERPSSLFGYSSSRQKRSPEKLSIIQKLLNDCKSTQSIPRQSRNIYQEFFDHPHSCYPTRKDSLHLPFIYTIKELVRIVLNKSNDLPLLTGNGELACRTSEWTYQVIDSREISENMVLLGHLRSSSTTGFMKLCDNTGKIPVLVGNYQRPCSTKTENVSSVLDYRDCVIKINQFDVVIETFRNCILQSVNGEKKNRIYLRTAMGHIEKLTPKNGVLDDKEVRDCALNDNKVDCQPKGSETLKKQQLQDRKNRVQSHDEEVSSSSHSKINTRALHCEAQKSSDQAITCTEALLSCRFTCKIVFLVRHRENPQLRKKKSIHYACAVDAKIIGFWSNEAQGNDDVAPDISHMFVREKSVVLRLQSLQSDTLMLHPFVLDGCFYSLTENVADKTQSLVMRELNNPSRTILNVTPSMTVTPIYLPNDDVTGLGHVTMIKAAVRDVSELEDRKREKRDGVTERCDTTVSTTTKKDDASEASHATGIRKQTDGTQGCHALENQQREDSVTNDNLAARNPRNVSRVTKADVTNIEVEQDGVTRTCHTRESGVIMAMKSALERFHTSDEDKLQSIEEILNDSSILSTNKASTNEIKQVNFLGVIILRELRQSDTCGQLLPGNNIMVPRFGILEESRIRQLELGFGYLGNKTLFLRVKDIGSPNTLDVYVDLNTSPYVDGLLPGAVVTCRRFLRKLSRKSNVYCSFEACSSLTLQALAEKDETPSTVTLLKDHQPVPMSNVPRRFLVDLITSETSGKRIQTISSIRCRVTSVQKLLIRWDCSRCSHVIVREECSQGCRGDAPFRFCAEARCLIEDGTAEALVYLSDDMVSFLLKLSNTELSKLKSLALSLGELLYQRHSYGYEGGHKSNNANVLSKQVEADRLLAERCRSYQIKRSIVLYCKSVGSFSKKMDSVNQEYDTRPIIINQTEHSTFVLPKLQLKAVNMTDVNYTEEIKYLLGTVERP